MDSAAEKPMPPSRRRRNDVRPSGGVGGEMRVTAVEEWTKSRSKVYLDGAFAFVLYRGELRSYHVREGEELASEDYREIMESLLPKRARLRAMNLLKTRDYTENRLRSKLKEGLYPEDAIAQALQYVASFHYVDDLRYAVSYITAHERTRSRRRIEQDLAARGIDRETLESAWIRWEADGGCQDEASMIEKLLKKRKYHPESADFKERQRTYSFLLRKGFSAEAVRGAMGTNGLPDGE